MFWKLILEKRHFTHSERYITQHFQKGYYYEEIFMSVKSVK